MDMENKDKSLEDFYYEMLKKKLISVKKPTQSDGNFKFFELATTTQELNEYYKSNLIIDFVRTLGSN